MEPLRDSWGREIHSVRVSVTDKCNFRCRYCMPAEGLEWLPRDEVLSYEEIARLVRVLARDGRRRGAADRRRAARPPRPAGARLAPRRRPRRRDLSLTTNGVLLDRLAGPLVEAGLTPAERLARLAVARPLRGDHPPRRARPRPRRPRRGGALSGAAPDQGQLRRRSAASPRTRSRRWPSSRAASRTSSASSSSCRSTPTRPGARTRC